MRSEEREVTSDQKTLRVSCADAVKSNLRKDQRQGSLPFSSLTSEARVSPNVNPTSRAVGVELHSSLL